jgi:hypothetical protein
MVHEPTDAELLKAQLDAMDSDDDDEQYHPTYQSDPTGERPRPHATGDHLHDPLMPDLEHDPRFTTDGDLFTYFDFTNRR